MADVVWKGFYPYIMIMGHSRQLSLNKFLIQSFLLREPQKSKVATRGPQNGQQGLERCPHLGIWVLPSTFAEYVF